MLRGTLLLLQWGKAVPRIPGGAQVLTRGDEGQGGRPGRRAEADR
jgi:hypothetical protein